MDDQLQLLLKSGTVCNLACTYCGDDVRGPERRLPQSIVGRLGRQLACLPQRSIVVAWHGGEPLTAGRSYFSQATDALRSGAGRHQTVYTCVHTNGLLLDDAWMALFEAMHASVSVSMDGPEGFHDRYRRNADGDGSFRHALSALKLAGKSEVGAAVGATVHDDSWTIAAEFVRICASEKVNQLHFEPRLQRGPTRRVLPVASMAFRRFVQAVSEAVSTETAGSVEIPTLGEWLAPGEGSAESCVFSRRRCFSNLAIDWDGEVFPCDLFHGESRMCIGNVHHSPLSVILRGNDYTAYKEAASVVPAACHDCAWAATCRGGCPYHRFMATGTFESRTPYCARAP